MTYQDTLHGDIMKNDERIIYVCNRKGRILQSIRKVRGKWTQTIISNGNVRTMTAEQLLSHLLPALAGVSVAKLKVIRSPLDESKNTDTNNG